MGVYNLSTLDVYELRRRLDDMQLRGMDLPTIEKQRELIDSFVDDQKQRAALAVAIETLTGDVDELDGLGAVLCEDLTRELEDVEMDPKLKLRLTKCFADAGTEIDKKLKSLELSIATLKGKS